MKSEIEERLKAFYMNSAKIAKALAVRFLASAVILALTFPIWEEFRYKRYSNGHWVGVYLSAAAALALLMAIQSPLISRFLPAEKMRTSATLQFLITLLMLSVVAVLFGISTFDIAEKWPLWVQYIDAKFFAELGFLRFVCTSAVLMSAISTLCWARWERRSMA